MTDRFLAATAPVFRVDGSVAGALARDCRRLEVTEDTEGLKTLKLWLTALSPSPSGEEETVGYLDGTTLSFGSELGISVGPPGDDEVVFEGKVSALEIDWSEESDPLVVVFAEDRLMDLRMTRRMRTHEAASDADIARAIAREHGLRPQASADGPTYDVVQQWNVSDLAFLRERALRVGAEVWVQGNTLHFQSRTQRTTAEVPTLVRGGNLLEVRIRADLAHQRSEVKVSGYDARKVEASNGSAGKSALGGEGMGGTTGPDALGTALGRRTAYQVLQAPLTRQEADAWAKAEMLRRARRFVTASGVTDGSPTMVVGSEVTLDRVGAPFDGGGYYVTSVRHTYDLAHGFRTRFEAERPFVRRG